MLLSHRSHHLRGAKNNAPRLSQTPRRWCGKATWPPGDVTATAFLGFYRHRKDKNQYCILQILLCISYIYTCIQFYTYVYIYSTYDAHKNNIYICTVYRVKKRPSLNGKSIKVSNCTTMVYWMDMSRTCLRYHANKKTSIFWCGHKHRRRMDFTRKKQVWTTTHWYKYKWNPKPCGHQPPSAISPDFATHMRRFSIFGFFRMGFGAIKWLTQSSNHWDCQD